MVLIQVVCGFAAATLLGVYLPHESWAFPVCLVCLLLGGILTLSKRLPVPKRVLFGVALALAWLTLYGALYTAPAAALENRTVRISAVVLGQPEETDHGIKLLVKAGEVDGHTVKGYFYGDASLQDLQPGDQLSCVAYCTPTNQMFGTDSLFHPSHGVLLHIKGYGAITITPLDGFSLRYAPARLAGTIQERIDTLYPPDQAGLLRALLTGDKSQLPDVAQHGLNRVGLGHVVVISGLHVTFLVGFLSIILKPKRNLSLALLMAALVLFSLMTGNAPGTVRATILSILSLLAPRLGRSYHPLTGLSFALLLLLLSNPYAIADVGLQFSFLSTLGIYLLGQPLYRRWLEKLPEKHTKLLKPLLGVLAISFGSMLLTVPLSALYFGRFSLVAPFANLLTSFSVSFIFLGGLTSVFLGSLIFPLGQALAALVGLPIRYFFFCSTQLSRLPLASIPVDSVYYLLWFLFAYGLLLLYLFYRAPTKRPILPLCACTVTLCLSLLLTAKTAQRGDLSLTALDVGQGQSVLLVSGSACAMVDCGGTLTPGDTAATYLQSLGRSKLDLLILTHLHADHAGGVTELMGRVQISAIALPDVDADSPLRQEIEALAKAQGTSLHYITQTQTVSLGSATLTLFEPPAGGKDSNELCLSALCTTGNWDALITGDMPAEGEALLTQRHELPDLEALVVGHHGSKHSTGEAFLDALRPEIAVVSVGYNSYGHPAPETLTRLKAVGAAVYRTDENGTITLYANRQEAQ